MSPLRVPPKFNDVVARTLHQVARSMRDSLLEALIGVKRVVANQMRHLIDGMPSCETFVDGVAGRCLLLFGSCKKEATT